MNLERLYEECAVGSAQITASPGANGEPHVIGSSATVSEILARRYAHGSVESLLEY